MALGLSVFPIALTAAEFTPIPSVSSGSRDVSSSAKNLLEQGMQAYYEGQLVSAIALWQKAIKQYQLESNQLGAAQAWTNLAMTYTLLGKGSEAKAAIANSLDLVASPTADLERLIRAEALNVQGILLLSWGQAQNAFASWQQASLLFQQARSPEGVFRSAVNQAKALQMLGLYPRACQKLLDILELGGENCSQLAITQLEAQLNPMVSLSPNHQAAWITLAIALRQVGNLEDSAAILQLILKKSPLPTQEGEIRFNLGKLYDIANEPLLALEQYQQALQFPLRPNQQMEVKFLHPADLQKPI
jgi:tetratricopeptide (TPR) repeat protein